MNEDEYWSQFRKLNKAKDRHQTIRTDYGQIKPNLGKQGQKNVNKCIKEKGLQEPFP